MPGCVALKRHLCSLASPSFSGAKSKRQVKHTQPFPADPKHQFPNLEPSFKEFLLEIVFAFCKLQASSLRSGLVIVVFLVSMNARDLWKSLCPSLRWLSQSGLSRLVLSMVPNPFRPPSSAFLSEWPSLELWRLLRCLQACLPICLRPARFLPVWLTFSLCLTQFVPKQTKQTLPLRQLQFSCRLQLRKPRLRRHRKSRSLREPGSLVKATAREPGPTFEHRGLEARLGTPHFLHQPQGPSLCKQR